MQLAISSNFDSGNIEVLSIQGPEAIDLAIRKDHLSDFYQWFYFRLTGAAGVPCTLRILNAAGSAYPDGWPHYQACVSEDRQTWQRAVTSYSEGALTIQYTPLTNSAYFAYFAPYTMERHADFVARIGQNSDVKIDVLGQTLDEQDLDLLTIGTPGKDKLAVWMIARQHPGETMAEWWMEGALDRLVDPTDPVSIALRQKVVFYVVPNMNPDGSRRGHLRTNAAGVNLNREWHAPSLEKSPEVYYVLEHMQHVGCDFCLDVHGDEALPYNFIAGFEGVPNATPHMFHLLERYKNLLSQLSPDFQTKIGYPPAKPGQANLTMSTNAIASRFGCLAMTLEMPFKDTSENPQPLYGWSPKRAKQLGRSCLDALHQISHELR